MNRPERHSFLGDDEPLDVLRIFLTPRDPNAPAKTKKDFYDETKKILDDIENGVGDTQQQGGVL